jgi:predicted nucleic acid-binding protein
MDAFVLDASVAVSWCFPDDPTKNTTFTQGVLDLLEEADALVPEVWAYEIANSIFVSHFRRKRIGEKQILRYVELLKSLPILVAHSSCQENVGLEKLARQFELTAYDVSYLALARQKGLSLATANGKLANAAKAEGVELVAVKTDLQP